MQENELYQYKLTLPDDKTATVSGVWTAFIAEDGSLRFTDQEGLIIAAFVAGSWVSVAKIGNHS